MKINILLGTIVLFLLNSCTLSSREIFDMGYQDKQILYTLEKTPFKSITQDGLFNATNYHVWNFDLTNMRVEMYDVQNDIPGNKSVYNIEVVSDLSATRGIFRLYGNGVYNNEYLGVVALTNAHGSFAKFHVQEALEGILDVTAKKPYWEYASDTILFRMHKNYLGQDIVTLDELEFVPNDYTIYKPVIRDGYYVLEGTEYTMVGVGLPPEETKLPDILLKKSIVTPYNMEVFEASLGGAETYLGMVFTPDPNSTKMKLVINSDFNTVTNELASYNVLEKILGYNLEVLEFAQRNNAAIRRIENQAMVLLSEVTPPKREYFWEQTDELTFNASTMTMRLVTTLDIPPPHNPTGVSNVIDYKVRILYADGDESGIMYIGNSSAPYSKYLYKYIAFYVYTGENGELYLDLSFHETEAEAYPGIVALKETPSTMYQNKDTALRPYRVAQSMHDIGPIWVRLNRGDNNSLFFDDKDTEKFDFLDLDLQTLRHTYVDGDTETTSYYKLKVAYDINNTNGVFQMKGYDSTFTTIDDTAPFNDQYMAIEKGSGLYTTQVKYGIDASVPKSIQKRNAVELFNLQEINSIWNDNYMLRRLEQVGMIVSLTDDRIYDPMDHELIIFNNSSSSMQIIQKKGSVENTYSFKMRSSKLESDIDEPFDVYVATGNDPASRAFEKYQNKHVIVKIIQDHPEDSDNYRLFITIGTSVTEAKRKLADLEAQRATLSYEYWTHEKYLYANIPRSSYDLFKILGQKQINTYMDRGGAIPTSVAINGYRFHWDDRLYNKRVPVSTSGWERGGAFNAKDYYSFDFLEDYKVRITLMRNGNPSGSSLTFGVRLLKHINNRRFAIQLTHAVDPDGVASTAGNSELETYFERRVLVFDIGDNTGEKINIGYATIDSKVKDFQEAAADAVNRAEEDLNTYLNNPVNFDNPNMVHASIAHTSTYVLRAFRSARQNIPIALVAEFRLFISAHQRLTNPDPRLFPPSSVLMIQDVRIDQILGDSAYRFTLAYFNKNASWGVADRPTALGMTSTIIRPIKMIGQNILIFRLHRPQDFTTVFWTNPTMKSRMFGQYHAITGPARSSVASESTMDVFKWVYGDTIDEVIEKMADQSIENYGRW